MKRFLILPLIAAGAITVSGCAGTTETERAILGAGIGATAAHVAGERDKTVILGAIGGAAAGLLCDDVGVCRDRDAYKRQPSGAYTYPVILDGRTVYVRR